MTDEHAAHATRQRRRTCLTYLKGLCLQVARACSIKNLSHPAGARAQEFQLVEHAFRQTASWPCCQVVTCILASL